MVRRPLTRRQGQVMILLALDKSNKEIARELGIATNTVRVHVRAVYQQLGVSKRRSSKL